MLQPPFAKGHPRGVRGESPPTPDDSCLQAATALSMSGGLDQSHQLAAALCGTRACIDTGLQHLRAAASLLTAGCDSSQAEAALAAAEAALAHSIHNLSLAKAAAVQQLAGQLRAAAAAAAAAVADDDLQDTCCSSMTCYPAA
ncbi:hypothetical protein OEZ86_002137 [Tetradesmus obliquus]|nr:hypothetical protein OEZ86_002137 [Tetradesmus obliquus]